MKVAKHGDGAVVVVVVVIVVVDYGDGDANHVVVLDDENKVDAHDDDFHQ